MQLTQHAKKRMNQRGISDFTLNIIMQHGRLENAPGGATALFYGKKEHQKTISELKRVIQLLDRAKNTRIIMKENHILTVYKALNN